MKIEGIYQTSGKGFGFLVPTDGVSREDDWFIPPRCQGGAWNGDKVSAEPRMDRFGGERRTAAVTAVLERVNRTVTGAIERRGRELWLRPTSERLTEAVRITGKTGSVRPGDKAAVLITSYGSRTTSPLGTLKEVFGRDGTREAAVSAILYNYHIEPEFPREVLKAAETAPQEVEPDTWKADSGRLDLREKTIITIDGASAKDLDDAVSLERDEEGRWVLGVHIADVSHYVTEGAPLDQEAWDRGTSVYFADQVIPMLPHALSNGICSLNPQVDRLTLSCIMTMGRDGEVLDHTIAKSVIRTTERMTYEDCNLLLEDGDPALAERYAHILPMLREMGEVARKLEKRRRLRGALDLESRECYVVCDEEGNPVGVSAREPGVSEGLIESFMLCANETVAKHLNDGKLPGVYRIHEKPSEDKTNTLRTMLAPLGYDLTTADNFTLQKALEKAKGTPQAPAIHMMVLRSLMKARYDTENLGHFGLAAKDYCHFTSPIRRYPDLMVHRMLTLMLDGKIGSNAAKLTATAQRAAVQSSERELAAMNAEREIERCYLAEYMRGHLGETFPGAVSGVTRFGLFIALENGVEGLLSVAALPDDQYEYDEVRLTLTGLRSGGVYTFGMTLEVVCAAADVGSGQIDFILPGSELRVSTSARPREARPAREGKKHTGKRPAPAPGRRKGKKKR